MSSFATDTPVGCAPMGAEGMAPDLNRSRSVSCRSLPKFGGSHIRPGAPRGSAHRRSVTWRSRSAGHPQDVPLASEALRVVYSNISIRSFTRIALSRGANWKLRKIQSRNMSPRTRERRAVDRFREPGCVTNTARQHLPSGRHRAWQSVGGKTHEDRLPSGRSSLG